MTAPTPYLISDLKMEEALRLVAYPDPKSGGAPWTIGYGHTGREVHPGLVWTQTEAETALAGDVGATIRGLDTAIPWWRSLDDLRGDVLIDMAFNMGVHELLEFHAFLALVKAGSFNHAALDMMSTPWAHEVGRRADRLERQMATGKHVLLV